jgi:cytochrome P450 family 2 subfamily B
VVVLCGTQTIREALVNNAEAFSGRGTIAAAQLVMQDYGEILERVEWMM